MASACLKTIQAQIATCQQIIGHRFANPVLVMEALNGSGVIPSPPSDLVQVPNNTRLAIYGDIASSLNLCTYWVNTTLPKGGIVSMSLRVV